MEIHLPPKLLVLCLTLTVALHFLWPTTVFVARPYNLLGLLFLAVGAGLTIWTRKTMQANKTTLHPNRTPQTLVTNGPFRLSRNPYYVGYLAMSLGLAVIMRSFSAFLGPALFFVLMSYRVIPAEEKNLQKEFGLVYGSYAQKVRRWI